MKPGAVLWSLFRSGVGVTASIAGALWLPDMFDHQRMVWVPLAGAWSVFVAVAIFGHRRGRS